MRQHYSSFGEVAVSAQDRLLGTYIIGATGTGKSTLISSLIQDEINNGFGVCLLDPHGTMVDTLLGTLTQDALDRTILLDLTGKDLVFGLNLFDCPDLENVDEWVVRVLRVFEKVWGMGGVKVTGWGATLENMLRNLSYLLIENPGMTMAEIPLLLWNDLVRKKLLENVTNLAARSFWEHRYDPVSDRLQREQSDSTENKVNAFLIYRQVLGIVGQSKTTLNMTDILDSGTNLFVKLDTRNDDITTLIGTMLVSELVTATYNRQTRQIYFLYADEFQRFATQDFARLLAEARKFGVATTVAHQYREQLDVQNRNAALNAGNLVVFRISGADAEELAPEFSHTPEPERLEIIPEEYIDGVESLLTVTQSPFDHLVRTGHSDPHLNVLVSDILKPIANAIEIVKIEEEEVEGSIADKKSRLEQVVITTYDGREYVATRKHLLEGKHLINRLLFDLMQGSIALHSETMVDRLSAIVAAVRGLFGIASGVIWFVQGEPEYLISHTYNRMTRRFEDTYGGGFTNGYWKEIPFDDGSVQGAAGVAFALANRFAALEKEQRLDQFFQARVAAYTSKTETEWEQEYLTVAPAKRIYEQQEIASSMLLQKSREQLADLEILNACLDSVCWVLYPHLLRTPGDDEGEYIHGVFNPFYNTDDLLDTYVWHKHTRLTNGLVAIGKPDFPRWGRHENSLQSCEGYRFKKELTATFVSNAQRHLERYCAALLEGTDNNVKSLVEERWMMHRLYGTLPFVNRKAAAATVREVAEQVNQVINPLYEDAIFWFYPSLCFDLGSCTCKTDPSICPFNLPCKCQQCQLMRATTPQLGSERTDKYWPVFGNWLKTAFPQPVAWLKAFAKQKSEELLRERQTLEERVEEQRKAQEQLDAVSKKVADYEQSRTSVPIAEAEGERLLAFLSQFVQLCEMLADPTSHIIVQSNQYRDRKRLRTHYVQHGQRQYSDTKGQVAEELAKQPNFTARAKLAGEEQTIEVYPKADTTDSQVAVSLKEDLVKRGILRRRSDVEAEIVQRQRSLLITEEQPEETHNVVQNEPPNEPKGSRRKRPA